MDASSEDSEMDGGHSEEQVGKFPVGTLMKGNGLYACNNEKVRAVITNPWVRINSSSLFGFEATIVTNSHGEEVNDTKVLLDYAYFEITHTTEVNAAFNKLKKEVEDARNDSWG